MAEEPISILALGDSLIAGYGLPPQDAFPAQLEEALSDRGWNVRVTDAGVSGDTTAGGRARLGWVLESDPDLVLLCLGANDGLRGLDPAMTADNLEAMVATIIERGIPLLLSGMLAPPNLGRRYGELFNQIYPRLARQYPEIGFDPFFLDGIAAVPSLNQADGIHPNAEGVRRIANRVADLAAAMLRERMPDRRHP